MIPRHPNPLNSRCVAAVYSGGWHRTQCSRPRGHGEGGEWCSQHAKLIERGEAREKSKADAIAAHRAEQEKISAACEKIVAILRQPEPQNLDGLALLVAQIYDPLAESWSVVRPASFLFEHLLTERQLEHLNAVLLQIDTTAEIKLAGEISEVLWRLGLQKLKVISEIIKGERV